MNMDILRSVLLPNGKILFYNDSLYYSANSVLNVSTSVGKYTGNDAQTRTINVNNGKFLLIHAILPRDDTKWGTGTLMFVQYGTTLAVKAHSTISTVMCYITFNNNEIVLDNQTSTKYYNILNEEYEWIIFA